LDPGSRSLLIRGRPGSGKTTLALHLLDRFGRDKGIYVSSRVSEENLHAFTPWSFRLAEGNRFEDLRLASAESFVSTVFSKEREKTPIVVLDSWDSFAKKLKEDERLKTEEVLTALSAGAKSRLIFVSEEPRETNLDYLVDGVVELTTAEHAGRFLRVMHIEKLRGTPILRHRILFSLHNGRATEIGEATDRHSPQTHTGRSKRRVQPSLTDFHPITDRGNAYSLGTEALDAAFSGIRMGSMATIEYGSDVPSSVIRRLTFPFVLNFHALGRSILGALPLNSPTTLIDKAIMTFKEDDLNRMRLLASAEDSLDLGLGRVWISEADSRSYFGKLMAIADKLRAVSRDGRLAYVLSTDHFEYRFSNEKDSLMYEVHKMVSRVQNSEDIIIFLTDSGSGLKPELVRLSYLHMKLVMIDGSAIAFCVKPFTGAFAVEDSANPYYPTITPMM
jgi:KaiC/GvpD/RAD55 family RecA-like ATPase